MKNIIITGSSGMVGKLALDFCLKHDDVKKVTIINRKKSEISHPKLIEVIHNNFLDFSSIEKYLKNQDVCIYCIGVYTGQVPRNEFRKITVDYTKAFAQALVQFSKNLSFSFLSGQGADSKEKSRMAFAKDKGTAENTLLKIGFKDVYIFRPGYIYPVMPRKEPNVVYGIMRRLYKPILSKIYPNIGVTSEHLAQVMVDIGIRGGNKIIYENIDIRNHKVMN